MINYLQSIIKIIIKLFYVYMYVIIFLVIFFPTDFDLFLKLSREFTIRSQNEVLCSYRVHKNSLTSKNYMSPALESIKIVSRISRNPYEKRNIKYMYATLAYAHFKYKNYFEMIKVIFKYKIFWQLLVKIFIVKLDLIPPKNF